MRYLCDTGFVIKRINFSDADRYITLFTRHYGKVEVIAHGVRKISSKRAAHMELLNLIRFQTVKTKKNIILTEVSLEESFPTIRNDYQMLGMMFLVCELLDRLTVLDAKHEDVFDLVYSTLKNLEKEHLQESISKFQLDLLSRLGFWDEKKKLRTKEDIDRYMEKVLERKVRTKSVFKL